MIIKANTPVASHLLVEDSAQVLYSDEFVTAYVARLLEDDSEVFTFSISVDSVMMGLAVDFRYWKLTYTDLVTMITMLIVLIEDQRSHNNNTSNYDATAYACAVREYDYRLAQSAATLRNWRAAEWN